MRCGPTHAAAWYHATKDAGFLDRDGNPHPVPGALRMVACELGVPDPARPNAWSVYSEMRSLLAARGVPAGAIRFAQDADSDRKKAALWEDARTGRCNFVIGSAQTAGTGVDVPDRLQVLDYMTLSWNPTQFEQWLGRIVRQGNQNPEVAAHVWATEGTIEVLRADKIAMKSAPFEALLDGTSETRRLTEEDDNPISAWAAEMTARMSGNPLLTSQREAQLEVDVAQGMQNEWQRENGVKARRLAVMDQEIQELQAENAAIDDALSRAVDTKGDKFAARVGTRRHTARAKAGAALIAALTATAAGDVSTLTGGNPQHLAELAGFPVAARYNRVTVTMPAQAADGQDAGPGAESAERILITLGLEGVPQGQVGVIDAADLPGRDPAALITSLEDRIRRLPGHKEKNAAAISGNRDQITKTRAELAQPSPYLQQLAGARDALDRIEAQISEQMKDDAPDPDAAESGVGTLAGDAPAVPDASPATQTAARADEVSRARAQSDQLADGPSREPSAPPSASAAGEKPDIAQRAPDETEAKPAAVGSEHGQGMSPTSPSAADPGTRTGSTVGPVPADPAPGPDAKRTAQETGPGRQAPGQPSAQPPAPGFAQPMAPPVWPPTPAPAPAATSHPDQAAGPEAEPAAAADRPAEISEQPAPGHPAPGLVIEHHQQGTLVHGTQKSDRPLHRILHNNGFRWSNRLDAWYLSRNWTYSTRNRRVSSLSVDLRQAQRSFTLSTQLTAPADVDEHPPEPLPAADPYTGLRQARDDHWRAVSDYWALTRTPASNNVMSTYPESGARPDVLALNAAYKAVPASGDEAFAGDPHEVADRFTAWAQAASLLARHLADERHRASKFRQTLDTFIDSAIRLASRAQATAQDPAAWARVFAGIPASTPTDRPSPGQATTPDFTRPATSGPEPGIAAGNEQAPQGSGEPGATETPAAGTVSSSMVGTDAQDRVQQAPDLAPDQAQAPARPAVGSPHAATAPEGNGQGHPGGEPAAAPALPDACRNAADLRQLATAHGLRIDTGRPGAGSALITVVHHEGRTVVLHDDISGTTAGGHRLDPAEVPAYLAAYVSHPQLPPRCVIDLIRADPATPGVLTLTGAREIAARHDLDIRIRRRGGQAYITFCEPGIPEPPVLSYPAGIASARHGPCAVPVPAINSYLLTYRASVPSAMFAVPAAGPRDWARRVAELTPHLVDGGGYFLPEARDYLRAAITAAHAGDTANVGRLLEEAEAVAPPLIPVPEREAELAAVVSRHAARYGYTEDPAAYMARATPALLDASDREWDWVRAYISAHPEVREQASDDGTAAQAAGPDDDREGYIATFHRAAAAFRNGDFGQALTLLDQAELQYPASAIAVAGARGKVHARMQQAGPAQHQNPGTSAATRPRAGGAAQAGPAPDTASPDAPGRASAGPGNTASPSAAGQEPDTAGSLVGADAGRRQPGTNTAAQAQHTATAAPGRPTGDETATQETAQVAPAPQAAAAASASPSASQVPAAAAPGTGKRPAPDSPADSGEPEPAASPLTNSDLAAELRCLPGFALWLRQAGTPPAVGDLDSQRPGAGSSAVCDARGIEITASGPGFTRHGLVTWPQAASWIDNGVTPARLGLVIIADRLSTFCRDHRDQLITAGTCDPDTTAAELGQIRDNAIAMIVTAALRSRGAAVPVPPARPDDPAWYTAVITTRPARGAGKAENAALEQLTQVRTLIREPQPATAAEIRATLRRWIGSGPADLVRALDDPAAVRAWINGQASPPVPAGYDNSGERWYGSSPDGLITDRNGDDRAPSCIRWEDIPAWIQPGITSSLRDRLLAAADASSAIFRRTVSAAVRRDPGAAPGEEEDKQARQRLREAVSAAWAAIEAAPPPSPADLDRARRDYRDWRPAQQTLFDDLPQDSTRGQHGTRAAASRPPRPAPSGPAPSAGNGRPAAKAAAPQQEPVTQQDPPSPAAGPAADAGRDNQQADRPDQRTSLEHDPPADPPKTAPARAAGTTARNPGTVGPASAGPAHGEDPGPPPAPATNSDLAIALHHVSGQELTSFLTRGETSRHGSRGWRRDGLPDAGASQNIDFDRAGVRITVRSRRSHRHRQISWRQVASWIDTGLTPARLGIITAASGLHIFTYARRDELIAAGKDGIDAAIRELSQISTDAIDAALSAALGARDADAPVPPARSGKPAYRSMAMLTGPDPSATPEENTTLARIAELGAAIRGTQPVTPADIRTAIRWWIGDSLPEYARALAGPEAMRAWIRRQASGPASRPGHGAYDSGRYYSACPEGLRTSRGSDTRIAPWILWEEIPAWIQPGLSASLRDRLAAAEPRPAPGRTRTAAARPPAGTADPAGQADDPLPGPLREAIDAAWVAIEAAPPPAPADLDHARTVYRGTGTARQPLPAGPAETSRTMTPAPRPRAEPRPAQPPRRPGPAAHRQDELPGATAASAPAGPPSRRDAPAQAGASIRPGLDRVPEPAGLPQPASTPVPLTDDDIYLGISRLPAVVIGDLFNAIDAGRPWNRPAASSRRIPGNGRPASPIPEPGKPSPPSPPACASRSLPETAAARGSSPGRRSMTCSAPG